MDEKLAFEAWRTCGATGGSDKNHMIQIVTWLLGFSAAIIGLQVTNGLPDSRVALLGVLVSLVAAYVALLYGGYAAWNWSVAYQIAQDWEWRPLQADHDPVAGSRANWQWSVVRRVASPCHGRIAPVFWMFFGVSLLSAAFHVAIACGVGS